jgi:hypothetical protein
MEIDSRDDLKNARLVTKFYADLNPAYPSKGERKYAAFRREDSEVIKLKQFNALKAAEKWAIELERRYWRRENAARYPYLGD